MRLAGGYGRSAHGGHRSPAACCERENRAISPARTALTGTGMGFAPVALLLLERSNVTKADLARNRGRISRGLPPGVTSGHCLLPGRRPILLERRVSSCASRATSTQNVVDRLVIFARSVQIDVQAFHDALTASESCHRGRSRSSRPSSRATRPSARASRSQCATQPQARLPAVVLRLQSRATSVAHSCC